MVLEVSVVPGNAQVELSAVAAETYPQWPTGNEAAVADSSTVAVSTRPDMEGPVRIVVGEDLPATTASWSLVFEGVLTSPSGRYNVGSGINGALFDVGVSAGRLHVRAFVRPSVEPSEVAFWVIAV
jgi:hypothetical protein